MNLARRSILISMTACFLIAGATCPAQTPNPNFDIVTSKLDKGGSLYIYVSLDNALENLIKQFEPLFA